MKRRTAPLRWFNPPRPLPTIGLIVLPTGQVHGYAWLHDTEIATGHPNRHVIVPRQDRFDEFLTSRVGYRLVGRVTSGPPAPLQWSLRSAQEWYRDQPLVALVACGTDEHGVWVAGAAQPSLVRDETTTVRVGGDWRRVGPDLRLVGLRLIR